MVCPIFHFLHTCLFSSYETVTSMLMQPSPETHSPEDTESVNQELEVLPPAPFCDSNLISATEEAAEDNYKALMNKEDIYTQMSCKGVNHVTLGSEPSGRSLVDCLRLAASEVERDAEVIINKPDAETSNGKRMVRKVKISREESSSVGQIGQTGKNEQKPAAGESSKQDIERSRKPSPAPETNTSPDNKAPGLYSTDSLLKEGDCVEIASEEPIKIFNEDHKEIKPDLQKKETCVISSILSESPEEELEFEMGQEDLGTVWLAELYMDEG